MASKHTSTLSVKGNAKKKLEEIAEAADKMAAGFKESGKSAVTMGGAIAVATAALDLLIGMVKDGKEEFVSSAKAMNSLNSALKAANATSKDISSTFAKAKDMSFAYNISLSETTNSLTKLMNASGDAVTAQQDMQRAVKISKEQNIELTESVQILAEARKGEVEGLKKLRGFDKATVDALSGMENGAARTATAFDHLNAQLGDLNDVTKSNTENMESFEDNLKKVGTATFGIAKGFGDLILTLVPGEEDWFEIFARSMANWSDEIQNSATEVEHLFAAFSKLDSLEFIDAILSGDPIGYALDMQAAGSRKDVTGFVGGPMKADDVVVNPANIRGGKSAPKKKKKRRGRTKELSAEDSGFLGDFDKELTMAEQEAAERWEKFEQDRIDAAEWGAKKRAEIAEMESQILKGKLDKRRADVEAFEESKIAAAQTTLDAAVGIAGQLGANEAAVAGIRAAIEVGEGIAALAPTPVFPFGNPAGAAAHFAAAAQFGVAAAMSGSGGGASGAKKASVSSAGSSANRDRLNAAEAQPTETNINLDFSRSIGVGPQAGKEVAELAARGVSMVSNGEGRLF